MKTDAFAQTNPAGQIVWSIPSQSLKQKARFSAEADLMASTLHWLENGSQSITLKKLEPVFKRLKCRIADVFPD